MDSPRRFEPLFTERAPEKKNPFDSLRDNQVALILLGIVIGYLLANMRPIVFQAK